MPLYTFVQVGWYVIAPYPLEQWHQWSWFERVSTGLYTAHVRFDRNKLRAEEMLEQYLAQMPEDVRALALGEEGAA